MCTQRPCPGYGPEATRESYTLTRTSGSLFPKLLVDDSVEAPDMWSAGSDDGSECRGSPEVTPLQDNSVGCGTNVGRCWLQGKGRIHGCFRISPVLLGPAPAGVSSKPRDGSAVVSWKAHLFGITSVIEEDSEWEIRIRGE